MGKQGGLSTGDMARKVVENEPEKLQEELKARQRELGLDNMVPNKNQDILQQLEDIGVEKNNILDQMQKAKEERLKKTEEQKKAKQKTMNQKLKMYFAQQERKAKQAYDSRRLVYLGGGFDQYEGSIRMTSFRVLLKEIVDGEHEEKGVIVPETHTERFPHYKVLAVGDGCDGIEDGMTVIVEAYAGTEVVSGKDVYRIVTCDDILGEVEK